MCWYAACLSSAVWSGVYSSSRYGHTSQRALPSMPCCVDTHACRREASVARRACQREGCQLGASWAQATTTTATAVGGFGGSGEETLAG